MTKGAPLVRVIETRGDMWLRVYTPFSQEYINDLKNEIPKADRRWNPGSNCWVVQVRWTARLKTILERHWHFGYIQWLVMDHVGGAPEPVVDNAVYPSGTIGSPNFKTTLADLVTPIGPTWKSQPPMPPPRGKVPPKARKDTMRGFAQLTDQERQDLLDSLEALPKVTFVAQPPSSNAAKVQAEQERLRKREELEALLKHMNTAFIPPTPKPPPIPPSPPSYYTLLGVKETATAEEIKKAYRAKAMQLHPDRNKAADAHDQFMRLKEAYATLSDPQKRKRYDVVRNIAAGKTPATSPTIW